MTYSLIDLTRIFNYKGVPDHLKTRVLKLPAHIKLIPSVQTGFPTVDDQLEKEMLLSVNWEDFPERNLTQYSLIDAFTELVHQYGYKRVDFYADKLGVNNRDNLRITIQTLTGISAKDFIIRYTLQMIKDLRHRTDLYYIEIGKLLHFPSQPSLAKFLKTYAQRYTDEEWKDE